MRQVGQLMDVQKVKLKTKYGEKTVPYHEVRLGIHDPSIEDSVCKEALLRMGSHREATVYQIIKERKVAASEKKIKAEKKKKKEPVEKIEPEKKVKKDLKV